MGFELSEGYREDVYEAAKIHMAAWKENDIWECLMEDVDPEEGEKMMTAAFEKYCESPDKVLFKMTEVTTGKLVAYTWLKVPWTLTQEQQAIEARRETLPKGIKLGLAKEFFELLGSSKKYGFNPERDFLRRGTMVHPAFQRRGLGTRLTKHCNDIADKAGAKTYVVSRPSSRPMFDAFGFKIVGTEDIDMSQYGEEKGIAKSWILVREPNISD